MQKDKGGKMSKEYTDKQINSMILHLRLNDIAEMYYIENQDDSSRDFYDYRTDTFLTKKQVIALALETKWESK